MPLTRRIALMNQKGGVGKTTTTVNLAAGLAALGQRVCIVDLDPQAHSTTHLAMEPADGAPSIYDSFTRRTPLAAVRRKVDENLYLVPSSIDLAAAEVELAGEVGRELLLRDLLADDDDDDPFDFVLFDCPPSLGVLTLNALTAAGEVVVPLQPHFFALHGLGKLLETVQLVARRLNPKLVVAGVVLCLYESGTRLSAEVLNDLEAFLSKVRAGKNTTPWSNALLYRTRIRRNIRLAESTSFGQTIFQYDPTCHGARDYAAFSRELLSPTADEPTPTPAPAVAAAD
ncbi:MAG: ParA family protein [Planctomycetia bacterium]